MALSEALFAHVRPLDTPKAYPLAAHNHVFADEKSLREACKRVADAAPGRANLLLGRSKSAALVLLGAEVSAANGRTTSRRRVATANRQEARAAEYRRTLERKSAALADAVGELHRVVRATGQPLGDVVTAAGRASDILSEFKAVLREWKVLDARCIR